MDFLSTIFYIKKELLFLSENRRKRKGILPFASGLLSVIVLYENNQPFTISGKAAFCSAVSW